MNINALRDQDASAAGLYAAACGSNGADGWPGCVLFRSPDGTSYSAFGTLETPATMGVCTTVLGNYASHPDTVDEKNTVTVTLLRGELSSITYAQLLEGGNACVVGDEVLCFRTAILVSGTTYKLSGLLRGRRGSEYTIGTHVAAERFVVIGASSLKFISLQTTDIDKDMKIKAVTVGGLLADAPVKTFTYQGGNFMPYGPSEVKGIRDATGELTIRWVRRNRIGGEWRNNVDVMNSEATEAYEVDVYTDNTYAIVKRTLTSATPSVLYSVAQQTTDFGAAQATISVKVYQISGVVGRGRPTKASV